VPHVGTLISNPAAGQSHHGKQLAAIERALAAGGWEVATRSTAGPGHATELARTAAAAGAEAVFAFGGDGTVRETAAGLLGTTVPLGILPGGTVNLLALALGLPGHPVAAAAAVPQLEKSPFDVGLAGATPFLMMVSAGLDATALSRTRRSWKRWLGEGAIGAQALFEWWRYAYPSLTVESTAEGERESQEASFAVVANIPFFGGPLRLVPQARPDDGRLDLLTFRGRGRRATLGFAWDAWRGAHLRRPDVHWGKVDSVTLRATAGMLAQIDGDVCTELFPLTVRLGPERLWVLRQPSQPPRRSR
jgi:diacylglycerol kinase (ATP)